jgi:two-component system chemotaxis response regulator CheB
MVVDDSVVVRGLVSRWVGEHEGMVVTSTHRTGSDAVRSLAAADADVVILDIEMPDMDGMTALPLLLKERPGTVIIMSSTLTLKNADISLRCLSLGAADYLPKPSSNRDVTVSADFRRDLLDKVWTLGMRARQRHGQPVPRMPAPTPAAPRPVLTLVPSRPPQELLLKPLARIRPQMLLIGASTGGPQAVTALLKGLGRATDHMAIVVAQHMPPTFTTMFADHLKRNTGIPAGEACNGEALVRGRVYVAAGGRHLKVERSGGLLRLAMDDGPAVNFCRPSVDVLFGSVAQVAPEAALAVVLTGMGSDGARGAALLAGAGGQVLAQDEASSVVWGMPGATARMGVCGAVQPIDGLAQTITGLLHGSRA